jgi:hypothetical protein
MAGDLCIEPVKPIARPGSRPTTQGVPSGVASKLILDWSPEQISGWLKIEYPDDESMRVSHEGRHCYACWQFSLSRYCAGGAGVPALLLGGCFALGQWGFQLLFSVEDSGTAG